MGTFKFIETKIKDLYIIEPEVFLKVIIKENLKSLGLMLILFKIMNQNQQKVF